jgi:enamine deaminase RidA (YjgF/YER057c/UK114 family)
MSSPGDVYGQTRRCLEIILKALEYVELDTSHVVRTRVMITDIGQWREAARAHGEILGETRPATTFVEVFRFIDPDWLVELEADAFDP